ncbi:MFS transporter [Micromonospora lupini]|uniref:MFS transporter n=1 Tax=Micromonospora lupini TaxID=285679 RepID=UPI0033DB4F20
MRELLAIRQFRAVWMSRTSSAMGSALTMVAMALAVLQIGGSPFDLGAVLTAGAVTEIVLMLAGGVWADRLPRGPLMIGVDVARFLIVGALAVLLLTGQARVYHFVVVSVLSAVGRALYRPATGGLVAATVPAPLLQKADALLTFSTNSSALVGPAVAGLVIAVGSAGWVYLVDALSFLVSALLLIGVKHSVTKRTGKTAFWTELREGWSEVRTRAWLWTNLITHGLWNFGFSMIFVLGPTSVIGTVAGLPAWAVFSVCITGGSLAGSFLAMRLRARRPLVVGNLVLTAGAVPFVALAAAAPLFVTMAGAVVAALGLAVLGALWNSTLQQLVPIDRMSRVTAYDWVVSLSITPLAYAAAAPLAAAVGTRATMLVCAALIAIPSAMVVAAPAVRAIRRRADGTVTSNVDTDDIPAVVPLPSTAASR